MWEDIWTQVEPALANLIVATLMGTIATLGIVVPILLKRFTDRVAGTMEERTHVVVEEKHMRALHTAIDSGTAATVAKIKEGLLTPDKAVAIREVMDHATRSVPDALAVLHPTQAVWETLIQAAFERYGQPLNGTARTTQAGPVYTPEF
jgi:hypothetical protein